LNESIRGKQSAHAGKTHSHAPAVTNAGDSPVTTEDDLGFSRTTAVAFSNLLLDDELRQPFGKCFNSSCLEENVIDMKSFQLESSMSEKLGDAPALLWSGVQAHLLAPVAKGRTNK
jgi:hypothetical protein